MRRRQIALLAFMLATVQAAADPRAVPSAAQIRADIAAIGAKAEIARLSGSQAGKPGPSDWDAVISRIWRGDPSTIALAPLLAEGTDAATSESLGIALAHALPIAAHAVLRAVTTAQQSANSVATVCSAPFIEDSVPDLSGYLKAAAQSVARVQSRPLRGVRAACLRQLAATAKRRDGQ